MSSHSIFTVPTGTTPLSAMACSDSPCVVPVGDFEIFALGPGAEAPGWPCVVPVGDFGRKANDNVVLNHFAAVTVFAAVAVFATRNFKTAEASGHACRLKKLVRKAPFMHSLSKFVVCWVMSVLSGTNPQRTSILLMAIILRRWSRS